MTYCHASQDHKIARDLWLHCWSRSLIGTVLIDQPAWQWILFLLLCQNTFHYFRLDERPLKGLNYTFILKKISLFVLEFIFESANHEKCLPISQVKILVKILAFCKMFPFNHNYQEYCSWRHCLWVHFFSHPLTALWNDYLWTCSVAFSLRHNVMENVFKCLFTWMFCTVGND